MHNALSAIYLIAQGRQMCAPWISITGFVPADTEKLKSSGVVTLRKGAVR
jgi:hypothetical protein